jgi:hypothetical protein
MGPMGLMGPMGTGQFFVAAPCYVEPTGSSRATARAEPRPTRFF